MDALSRPPRGGRGLKLNNKAVNQLTRLSPSSRRAWIEILLYALADKELNVALLAEGVD